MCKKLLNINMLVKLLCLCWILSCAGGSKYKEFDPDRPFNRDGPKGYKKFEKQQIKNCTQVKAQEFAQIRQLKLDIKSNRKGADEDALEQLCDDFEKSYNKDSPCRVKIRFEGEALISIEYLEKNDYCEF